MPKTEKMLTMLFGSRTTQSQSPMAKRLPTIKRVDAKAKIAKARAKWLGAAPPLPKVEKPKAKPKAKAKAKPAPKAKAKLDRFQLLEAQYEKRFRKMMEAVGELDIGLANVRATLGRLEDAQTELTKDVAGIEGNLTDLENDLSSFQKVFFDHVQALNDDESKAEPEEANVNTVSLFTNDPETTPAPATITAVPGGKKFVRIGGELYEANGLLCEVCNEPQAEVIGSGASCANGHGGADGIQAETTQANGVS